MLSFIHSCIGGCFRKFPRIHEGWSWRVGGGRESSEILRLGIVGGSEGGVEGMEIY